jgi:hypothetical protein
MRWNGNDTGGNIVLVYAGDIIILGPFARDINKIRSYLEKCFSMKNMEEVKK